MRAPVLTHANIPRMYQHTFRTDNTAIVMQVNGLAGGPGPAPWFSGLDLRIPAGITAVVGDEGTGKTTLLRLLTGDLSMQAGQRPAVDALWLDLALPGHDEDTPEVFWATLQPRFPTWCTELQHELIEALHLVPHLGKKLFMLSTGSRRKVALVALLACGATLTCVDQPYASLDMASIQVLRDFFNDVARHPSRAWLVANYEADPHVPWDSTITLT